MKGDTVLYAEVKNLNEEAWSIRFSDVSKAQRLSKDALILAKELGDNSGIASSLLTQGFCHFKQGNYQKALENSKQSLELYETLNDLKGQQRALNTLGIVHGQSGNLSNALKTFLQVQKLCERSGHKEDEANALNNVGVIYKMLGDQTKSIETYLKSLSISESIGNEMGTLRTLQNIGAVCDEAGRYDEALSYYDKSLVRQDPKKDPFTYALTLSNIGLCHRKLNSNSTAFEYQYKSLAVMEDIKDKLGQSFVFDELGLNHHALGNFEEAKNFLEQSLKIKHELGDKKHTAVTCLSLGEVYLSQGEKEKALLIFKEALNVVETLEAKSEVCKAHFGLAKAYKLNRQFEEATQHLQLYAELRDDYFSEMTDQRFHALRVSYEVEQAEKEKEIYRLKSVALAHANAELTQLKEKLEKQANEDPLTGLFNRRVFNEKIESEFSRVHRSDAPMSIMICDIDNFKKVNDTFSHAIGDVVLKEVAQLFKANIRTIDTVARYGGEEFVILFPETKAQEAYHICERLRADIERHPWHKVHPDLRITISIGLCDDTKSKDVHEMVSKADNILYDVKRNGKNHIRIWDNAKELVSF